MPRLMYARAPRVALAVLLALATVLAVGAYAAKAPHGRAVAAVAAVINSNPVAAGPYHEGNITCAKDGSRDFIVWDHHCPSGFHYAQIPVEDIYGLQAEATAPPAPRSVPAPTTASGETAPVLSLNATPSATAVPLKWRAATPPSDDTITGYETRWRKTSELTWSAPASAGNVLSVSVAVLAPGTQYFLQVRAVYGTTADGRGPWSNTLTATTDTTI